MSDKNFFNFLLFFSKIILNSSLVISSSISFQNKDISPKFDLILEIDFCLVSIN
jgi:hypothetical protein